MFNKFLFILFIGLVIRIFFIGNTGFIADISFWKSWSLAAFDHGIVWTAHNTNINYPPGFIYILWLMGKLYSFIGDPHNYNDFWRENNFGFLFVSKSIAIVSDVIIACLIYWFASQKEKLKQLGAEISSKVKSQKSKLSPQQRDPAEAGQFKSQNLNSLAKQNEIFEDRIRNLVPTSKYYYEENNKNNQPKTTHNGFSIFCELENFICKQSDNLPLLLSSLFFLNPVVIIDSALWGQVESFGILFTIVAIILVFYKKTSLATFFFTIGTLMKLQNIIFIPLYFLFIFRYYDLKTVIKSLTVAAFTFFLICLPFILARNMDKVLYLLTVNSDYFPWLSLNATNLWWIVAGAKGMAITDRITVLGIMNAKTLGLMFFSSFYLLFVILLYKRPTPRNFFLSLTLGIFSFFLFTTQSHERYSYPVIVLLLFFYPFIGKNTSRQNQNPKSQIPSSKQIQNQKLQILNILNLNHWKLFGNYNIYFWSLYALLSLFVFLNIHTGLILNYPQNGFRTLSVFATPSFTIFNSYLLIILFILLLPFIFSQISKWWLGLCCGLGILGLFFLNFSYVVKGNVSLTSFKPVITRQDYGILQINKAVNSSEGWKKWNRLSGNYFYYRKGFGTHANSNLVFDINRKFSKFTTDYSVDTEAETGASIVFQIYGDGKELFTSEKMGRFDFPKHIEIPVSDIKYLGLVVNDNGDGINDDHADWLNPVLYR